MSKIYTILSSKKKKDGTQAVYLKTYINGDRVLINSKVFSTEEKWDETKSKIRGNTKEIKDQNLVIQSCKKRLNDIFIRYRLQNKPLTADLLRTEYKNPSFGINFYSFLDDAINERKGEIEDSTMRQHKVLLSKLKTLKAELTFSELTPDFLKQWERHLKKYYDNDINTIHRNMKNLKTYINIAIRKGLMQNSPFENVTIKKADAERIFLTKEELKLYWEKYNSRDLPDNQHKVMRHFLFMCCTGIRVSDLQMMNFSNIIGKYLVFNAHKTKNSKKKLIKVPLTDQSKKLIKDEGNKEGFIFNTYSEQKMRDRLKEITAALEIPKNVTNHTGRHTFATLFIHETHDVATLKELLGHTKIEDTMKYVHITEQLKEDQMSKFSKIFDL